MVDSSHINHVLKPIPEEEDFPKVEEEVAQPEHTFPRKYEEDTLEVISKDQVMHKEGNEEALEGTRDNISKEAQEKSPQKSLKKALRKARRTTPPLIRLTREDRTKSSSTLLNARRLMELLHSTLIISFKAIRTRSNVSRVKSKLRRANTKPGHNRLPGDNKCQLTPF
jgi:hypothetical protein